MTASPPPATQGAIDWATLDRHAWEVLIGWPTAAAFDPIHQGLDYALLSRWFLWDRVARAIRREHAPEAYACEITLLQAQAAASPRPHRARGDFPPSRLASALTRPARALRRFAATLATPSNRHTLPPGVIYLPLPNPRLNALALSLAKDPALAVVAGPHAMTPPEGILRIQPMRAKPIDPAFINALFQAILAGLRALGVDLDPTDADSLRKCLDEQARHIPIAAAELDALDPSAVLVHADNHPRPIHFVLLARQRGIPVFMLQHGLDCERHCLDDAYATHIAVWGPARAERYRRDSAETPVVHITGNPAWDDFRPPDSLSLGGDTWLWATRPHTPGKCYAPSRHCGEGLAILDALLDALAHQPRRRLLIKPHPYDYAPRYQTAIDDRGMTARATLTNEPLIEAMRGARIVITEDSTAGLEAMLLGKPIVHAHFAPSAPTTSFSQSGAALPGFLPAQLQEALARLEAYSSTDLETLHEHQRNFLDDHAGPLDGHALARATAVVRDLVSSP